MYRLSKFGTLDLGYANQVDLIGSGETPTAYHLLPGGGALDMLGAQQMYPGVVERTKSMRLTVSTETGVSDLYFQLLALVGKRDRLYREQVDGTLHWQYARLKAMDAVRDYNFAKFKKIQDVDLRFSTQEATWRGGFRGGWFFDSGENFDTGLLFDSGGPDSLISSPTVLTISVGDADDAGRAPVRAITITLEVGTVAMSAITIARTNGETLTFSGSVDAGDSLIIDTGTMQVTNNGIDAYDDITFSPTADMAAWFALEPGDNEITVSFTGGGTGSEITFNFYEAWR
jgi:tail protein